MFTFVISPFMNDPGLSGCSRYGAICSFTFFSQVVFSFRKEISSTGGEKFVRRDGIGAWSGGETCPEGRGFGS